MRLIIGLILLSTVARAQSDSIPVTIDSIMLRYMDEVVVKSTRLIAEEFKTNSFSQLDVYLNPSSKADPILAVNALPSATTLDESANISLRGSSPAETGIFFDNVPIHDAVRYSQLNGIGTFSIFNNQLINKVQVFPGNPPLEFGGTTSGLIFLDSKTTVPDKAAHKVSITLASLGYIGEYKTSERSALTVFTNYQPSFLLKSVNEASLSRLKKFDSNDLGLHWYLKTKSKAQLKLFNYSLRETYKFDYIEPTFHGDFNQNKKRNFTIASFTQPVGRSEISINQGASFSYARYGYAASSFNIGLIDYYTAVNFQHTGNVFDFKTGVTRERRHSNFDGNFNTYDYAIGVQYPHMSLESKNILTTNEVYGYVKYHGLDKLSLGTGIRSNLDYVSYQFNGRYEISEPWAILMSYGSYNKPDFNQFIESKQLSADLTYKHRASEGTLSLFSKKIYTNGTTTDVNGGELYYKYAKSRKLQTQVSLTTLSAIVEEGNSKYKSPYDLKYFIRGNVVYNFIPTWSFSIMLLYRDGTFYNPVIDTQFNDQLNVYVPIYAGNEGQKRLPYYGNISCNLSKLYTISDKFSGVAFAGLSNISDRKNPRGYLYNFDYTTTQDDLLSGRTLFFGTMISF